MRITIALAALLFTTALTLQLPTSAGPATEASLKVQVVDQTNAVLPRASVTVLTLDGKPAVTVKADDKGVVNIPALGTGMAQIVVAYPGFATMAEKATLSAGPNAQTVMLRLATLNEKITVTANPERGNRS